MKSTYLNPIYQSVFFNLINNNIIMSKYHCKFKNVVKWCSKPLSLQLRRFSVVHSCCTCCCCRCWKGRVGNMSGYTAVGSHTTEPVLERLLMMKQEAFVYKIPAGESIRKLIRYILVTTIYRAICIKNVLNKIKVGHYLLIIFNPH